MQPHASSTCARNGDVKFRVPVRFPGCDVYGFTATRTTPLSTAHRFDPPHEETQRRSRSCLRSNGSRMLTIFSTAKPFEGHSNVIQRNALESWTLLHPDVEVILFGDEKGTAEVCRDLGIHHEPHVNRNEHGTKYLNYIFDRAKQIARHNILCYANCDIMLTSDFRAALEVISKTYSRFLMIGRRWDTNITEPWDFNQPGWAFRRSSSEPRVSFAWPLSSSRIDAIIRADRPMECSRATAIRRAFLGLSTGSTRALEIESASSSGVRPK